MDDLFGDDDEDAGAAKGPSRAEQMAAAKAAKDKKKKVEKSNVIYEVKVRGCLSYCDGIWSATALSTLRWAWSTCVPVHDAMLCTNAAAPSTL